jgi:LysM repeat protein
VQLKKAQEVHRMRFRSKPKSAVLASVVLLGAWTFAQAATEEQRVFQISKNLKPISDNEWNEISKSASSDTYDVQKGDTLWDLSKKLFGNSGYWPKIWSLNNKGITNPHIISPGNKLYFSAGNSETMPSLSTIAPVQMADASSTNASSDSASDANRNRAHEYDRVSQQLWAPLIITRPPEAYDELGIDREFKVSIPNRASFRVPAIANDTTIPYLGEVIGSRREGNGLSQGETVFIRSNSQDLQVGNTYNVLSEPQYSRERKSDRSGYLYRSLGEIKILGVKDDVYVGLIVVSYDTIERGARLYPLLPVVSDIKPIPAEQTIESLVISDDSRSVASSSQFQYVFLDRGLEDGLQVGQVFRIYEYYDPTTRKKITDSDFMVKADVIVIHSTAQFSTGLILRSRDPIEKDDFGVLMTDISDLERKHSDASTEGQSAEDKELDELDALDRQSGEGLGRKERQEIKQLEQWDKTKDELQNEPATPSDTTPVETAPADQATPAPDAGAPTGDQQVPSDPALDAMPPAESQSGQPSSAEPVDPNVENSAPIYDPAAPPEQLGPPPQEIGGTPAEPPTLPADSNPQVDPAMPSPPDDAPAQ